MKKLTSEQVKKIFKHNARWFCNYYIEEKEHGVRLLTKVKLPLYLLAFIPACIIQAASLIWDGGLREFTPEPRTIRTDTLPKNSPVVQQILGLTK